jgi:hypothetical protein
MPRLLIAFCFLPLPATAQSVCAFDAYTDFGNPAPAIHAGPSASSAQVGTAPHGSEVEDGFAFGAYVTVTEMRSGWAHVTNVVSWNDKTTAPDGWINGDDIQFTAQTDVMFVEPDPSTDVVWKMNDYSYIKALLDCDGEWAKVIISTDNEVDFTGWVRGICATQETTCDGTFGDKAFSPLTR